MHGNFCFKSMLDVRPGDNKPKIATSSFLNVLGVVSHTPNEPMRYPVKVQKTKSIPQVRGKGGFKFSLIIFFGELLPQFAAQQYRDRFLVCLAIFCSDLTTYT